MTVKCRKYFLAKWNSDLVQWWQGLARRRSPHAEVLHTFRCRGERPEILEGPRRRPRRPQLVKNALNAPYLSMFLGARGEGHTVAPSLQLGLNFGSPIWSLVFTHSARTLWLGDNAKVRLMFERLGQRKGPIVLPGTFTPQGRGNIKRRFALFFTQCLDTLATKKIDDHSESFFCRT